MLEQSEFASLQRVGGAYWTPSADIGSAAVSGSTGGKTMQEFMDDKVAEITKSNS